MINNVNLVGRLVKDPEVIKTQKSTGAAFSLAFSNKSKDEEGNYTTSYIRCYAWNSTGDFVNKYLKKGVLVAVSGSLYQRSYTKGDGSTGKDIILIVDSLEAMQRVASTQTPEDVEVAEAKAKFKKQVAAKKVADLAHEIVDDDLPF